MAAVKREREDSSSSLLLGEHDTTNNSASPGPSRKRYRTRATAAAENTAPDPPTSTTSMTSNSSSSGSSSSGRRETRRFPLHNMPSRPPGLESLDWLVPTAAGSRGQLPSLSLVASQASRHGSTTPPFYEAPVPVMGAPDHLVGNRPRDLLPSLSPSHSPIIDHASLPRVPQKRRTSSRDPDPNFYADQLIATGSRDRTQLPSLSPSNPTSFQAFSTPSSPRHSPQPYGGKSRSESLSALSAPSSPRPAKHPRRATDLSAQLPPTSSSAPRVTIRLNNHNTNRASSPATAPASMPSNLDALQNISINVSGENVPLPVYIDRMRALAAELQAASQAPATSDEESSEAPSQMLGLAPGVSPVSQASEALAEMTLVLQEACSLLGVPPASNPAAFLDP